MYVNLAWMKAHHYSKFHLFRANLAPGFDYLQGVQKVLTQYNNQLTKECFITVLLDAGVERKYGNI